MDIGRKKGSCRDVTDNDTSIRVPRMRSDGIDASRSLGGDGEVEEKEGRGHPLFGGWNSEITLPVGWVPNKRTPFPWALSRRGSWGSAFIQVERLVSSPVGPLKGGRRRARRE